MEKVLEAYGVDEHGASTSRRSRAAPPGAPALNGTPPGAAGMQEEMTRGRRSIGSQGQTNPALAAAMGGARPVASSLSPDQFAAAADPGGAAAGDGRTGLGSLVALTREEQNERNRQAAAISGLLRNPAWVEMEAALERKIERPEARCCSRSP